MFPVISGRILFGPPFEQWAKNPGYLLYLGDCYVDIKSAQYMEQVCNKKQWFWYQKFTKPAYIQKK